MPNANVQFQGQIFPIPGSYEADNVQAALPANPGLIPPLIFIAYGYGGKYLTPKSYPGGLGLQTLQDDMRGGPGASFVPFIANPSPVLFGANQVTYINVGDNTASTLTLNSTSGTALLNLTSADYGPPSNLLQAEVDAGSQAGVQITLVDGYNNANTLQADNLGYPFSVAYTGAETTATWTVSGSATEIVSLTLSDGAVSGASITFPLGTGQYNTVQQLVEAINAASQPFIARVTANQSNAQQPTSTLDVANGTLAEPNAGAPQYVFIPGTKGGINFWINRFASSLATSAIAPTASGTLGVALPSGTPATHFSGATAVAPTNDDYIAAFGVAATIPGWAMFADSNDPGVIAAGVQSAFDCSQPAVGRPRRFISGSSIGDTVTEAQTQARDMQVMQGTYVYPGIYATDTSTGINTLYGGLYAAAAVASMMSGNLIAQPLTQQPLFGTGVEVPLTLGAGGEIDLLQQAGVMPVYISSSNGQPTIVSDFTTWQTDNNPENVFNQQVACRQALAYSLSQGLQPYAGSIASPFGLTAIKNATKSILNQLIYSPGNNGILVSWDAKNLKVTYTGSTQTVNIQVPVVFVGQVRFIFEYVLVQPLNLAA
jgi:hypothetical protein